MKNHSKQISASKQKIISAFIIGIGLQAVSATDSDFIPREDKPSQNKPTFTSLAIDYGLTTQESIDSFKDKITAFKIDHRPDFIALAASASTLPFWLTFHEKNMHQLGNLLVNGNQAFRFGLKNYVRCLGFNAPVQALYPLVNWKIRTLMQNAEKHVNRELYLFERLAIGFGVGASTAFFTNPYQTFLIEALKKREMTFREFSINRVHEPLKEIKPIETISLKTAFSNITQEYGIWGFCRGTTSMMVRNGGFGTSLFVGVPACQNWLAQHKGINTTSLASPFLASFLPAIIATCAMIPVDLKLMIMKESVPGNILYKTLAQTFRGAYATHGIGGLGIAFGSRFLANTVEFTGFHTLRRVLEERK